MGYKYGRYIVCLTERYLQLGLVANCTFFLDIIHQSANSITQPHAHLVAVLEVQWRVLHEANTLRRSGENNRTRLQCGALGKEGDGLANVEYLFAGEERLRWR